MRLSKSTLLCAALLAACAHDGSQRARSADGAAAPASTAPVPAARFGTAEANESPPAFTPASGVGAPRTATAALVARESTGDRAESTADRESIREIRELLAADRTLSPIAARVTMVAREGRIWLRGQVNTAEQRAAIERAARQAAGVIDVNNELVVLE